MNICLFCEEILDQNTAPEHILLDAFGGRATSHDAICTTCNNTFGRSIDNELAKQTIDIRNMFRMRRGSTGSVPTLSKVQAGEHLLNIRGNGSLEIANQKPFEINYLPDGKIDLRINLSDLSHLANYIPHIARKLGVDETKIRKILETATATETWERPGTRNLALSFGGELALRAATKACLVLWSSVVGNNEIMEGCYEAARSYAFVGCPYFTQRFTDLDARLVPCAPKLMDAYGPLFNLIWVSSNEKGKVIGHYTINNLVALQVVLAFDGATPNKRAMLVNDPLNPSRWSTETSQEIEIPFDWLASPNYYDLLDVARARITFMLNLYEPLMMPHIISDISDQVCAKYGFSSEDEINPLQAEIIKQEIRMRVDKHYRSELHTEMVPSETLKRYLESHP